MTSVNGYSNYSQTGMYIPSYMQTPGTTTTTTNTTTTTTSEKKGGVGMGTVLLAGAAILGGIITFKNGGLKNTINSIKKLFTQEGGEAAKKLNLLEKGKALIKGTNPNKGTDAVGEALSAAAGKTEKAKWSETLKEMLESIKNKFQKTDSGQQNNVKPDSNTTVPESKNGNLFDKENIKPGEYIDSNGDKIIVDKNGTGILVRDENTFQVTAGGTQKIYNKPSQETGLSVVDNSASNTSMAVSGKGAKDLATATATPNKINANSANATATTYSLDDINKTAKDLLDKYKKGDKTEYIKLQRAVQEGTASEYEEVLLKTFTSLKGGSSGPLFE